MKLSEVFTPFFTYNLLNYCYFFLNYLLISNKSCIFAADIKNI